MSLQVSLALGFPIWDVGVFDETGHSEVRADAGILEGEGLRVVLPGTPAPRVALQKASARCLPGGSCSRDTASATLSWCLWLLPCDAYWF